MIELIILEPSGNEQRITLDRDEYVLGRDPTVSIPLRDRKVSRQHARIFLKGSTYYIEDLGSVNGVLAGGNAIQSPRKLSPGLEFDVGGFIITVMAEHAGGKLTFTLTGRTPPFAGQEFLLPQGELEVGRVDGNAIVIPDTSVSRRHATVAVTESSVAVRDLGSSNGTFVNGDRITNRTVANGDLISFGNVEFEFTVTGEAGPLPVLGSVLGGRAAGHLAVALAGATVLVLIGVLIYLIWPGRGGPEMRISETELAFERGLDESLKQAEFALQQENWTEAQKRFREVLRDDPIHVRARDGLESASVNSRHEKLLERAERQLQTRDYRNAVSVASQIPSTAFYANRAATILNEAREKLADRAASRARAACAKQEWMMCYESAIEYTRLQPQSAQVRGLIQEAATAMRAREIDFPLFEPPPPDSDYELLKKYQDPELRNAIASLMDGDVANSLRRATELDTPPARTVVPTLSLLKREMDAASRAEESGNIRAALKHWKSALYLHGRLVPASLNSAVKNELEQKLGDELYKLGESAFQRGMHTDAFHYWGQGARLDPANKRIENGLRRLEQQGARILSELSSGSPANCALIREVLATTKQTSPVNIKARAASEKSGCRD